jgi:excisionase family DNA binding protein
MPRKPPSETPLYVRLPNDAVGKLDRASAALGIKKKDLVARLVTKYVDPDSQNGLTELGTLSSTRRPLDTSDAGPTLGTYSFQPYDPPEILNVEQAAQFLQIDPETVVELAEAGQLPGRKLGPRWRFSRDALVAWLSTPEKR